LAREDAGMSKHETPMTRWYWQQVGGTLITADRLLRAFLNSDFSQPAGTIIGIEEELRGELVPGCPDLLARVDLLVETDDALIVQDFKTSRSSWSNDHVIGLQLRISESSRRCDGIRRLGACL
jgi:hypothetical protein